MKHANVLLQAALDLGVTDIEVYGDSTLIIFLYSERADSVAQIPIWKLVH